MPTENAAALVGVGVPSVAFFPVLADVLDLGVALSRAEDEDVAGTLTSGDRPTYERM